MSAQAAMAVQSDRRQGPRQPFLGEEFLAQFVRVGDAMPLPVLEPGEAFQQPAHRGFFHCASSTAVAAATLRLSTAPLPGIETRRSHSAASFGSMPSPSAPIT